MHQHGGQSCDEEQLLSDWGKPKHELANDSYMTFKTCRLKEIMYSKGLTKKYFKYKDGLEILTSCLHSQKDNTNLECFIFDAEMSEGFDGMLGAHKTQIHKIFLERLKMVQKTDKYFSIDETPFFNCIEIPSGLMSERQTPASVQCHLEWVMGTKYGPLLSWLHQNCVPHPEMFGVSGSGVTGWKWKNILSAVSTYILSKQKVFFSTQNVTFCLIQSDCFFSDALGVNSFHRSEIKEILLKKMFVIGDASVV